MPTMLDTEPALRAAIRILLTVCDGAHSRDGAGFNGYDSRFARDLSVRGYWTPGQLWAVWKMLQKYKRQLTEHGFDLGEVKPPLDPKESVGAPGAPVSKMGTTIEMQADGLIVIRFPYNAELVELMRQVPGRTWDGPNKRWVVKPDAQSLDAVMRFAAKTGASLPAPLIEAHELARLAIEAAQKKAAEQMADSVATDADFHVDGLGGTLMPFQRAGVKYAATARKCLIADEMGLGKTVQALATAHHLKALPVLVVCPASLRVNWMREAKKWLPGTFAAPYELNPFVDVAVINYDKLPKYKDHIIERSRFKAVIFDEAHYLKNHKAQRSVAAREVARFCERKYKDEAVLLALTGTPVLNRPAELLHLLQVLGRLEDVGGFKQFRDRYLMGDFGGNGSNLEELQVLCRSRFLIRREKAQVLTDLPPKRRVMVDLPMSAPNIYKALEDKPLEESEAAALVRIGELRREAARQKLTAVKGWVEDFLENGKKLVLFAVHREIQAELMRTFPKAAHILGEDDGAVRQKAVDRFQEDPDCGLIICSLKAAGVGLTLTAASDVAFVEFGWTPGDMDQAEDRAHRIGQHDSVTAWYLKADGAGIDTDMLDLIDEKRETSKKLLDAGQVGNVDENKVKDTLVKNILAKARKAGRLIPVKE